MVEKRTGPLLEVEGIDDILLELDRQEQTASIIDKLAHLREGASFHKEEIRVMFATLWTIDK